ncbi:cellulase [Dyella sp. A6]|uniref:cellulase n=1 Tax=Dyella aluminiiresistens TaxID=3069105 RepID=UPI002E763849|nr:cellulase [Dyella sp. A6]
MFRRSARKWVWGLVLVAGSLHATGHPAEHVKYDFAGVRIGGGGYVTGLAFDAAVPGLLYARTDVGGAYRWDSGQRRWVSLTDWIEAADTNWLGIDSLALDPSDPNRLYLLAGTYTFPGAGDAAVLCSTDRGRHFTAARLPFPMGGNELGRGNGERLAVDPHDGRILFLGSRNAGLWRSDDHGTHWQQVKSFPSVATSKSSTAANAWRRQPIGIVFVVFDSASGRKGQPTPVLYAGVSTRQTSLFESVDGGLHWRPVPGQPTGLRPSHMHRSSDGSYYLTYGDQPGPDTMTRGAVWRWQPAIGRWTNITPLPAGGVSKGFGWGDVAIDPSNPKVLMASTMDHYTPHDLLFRSTDGGRHWTNVFAHSEFDHSNAVWTVGHAPHWMTRVVIDPADPDHVLFVTGYGIWASRDMRKLDHGGRVHWWFQDRGLEETVPLGLISPPTGAHLLSAVGDLDGFRHANLSVAPPQFPAPPRYANSESIDYAGRRPSLIVRSGYLRHPFGPAIRAAWSRDDGRHWTAFASEPPTGKGAGSLAVNADGTVVVWAPRGAAAAYRTTDFGRHWQLAKGLPGGLQIRSDRFDAQRFYAVDPATGALFASDDGGRSFVAMGGELATAVHGHAHVLLEASPRQGGIVYVAARDVPLLRADVQGHVLMRYAKLDGVDAFGFGKAAPGQHAPTLFVAGRLQAKQGIYRSIDGGRQWQEIDDAAHRYGRVHLIIGDPRVFGRVYIAPDARGIIYGEPAGGAK